MIRRQYFLLQFLCYVELGKLCLGSDRVQALQLYGEAASRNDSEALFHLAGAYQQGWLSLQYCDSSAVMIPRASQPSDGNDVRFLGFIREGCSAMLLLLQPLNDVRIPVLIRISHSQVRRQLEIALQKCEDDGSIFVNRKSDLLWPEATEIVIMYGSARRGFSQLGFSSSRRTIHTGHRICKPSQICTTQCPGRSPFIRRFIPDCILKSDFNSKLSRWFLDLIS